MLGKETPREKGLGRTVVQIINNADFNYMNSLVRIIANRNHQEIKLAGLTIGPFEEGNEYEVYNWVAEELEKAQVAHKREDDRFDASKLYRIQWRERAQIAGQITKPSDNFYPELRRCLAILRREAKETPEKLREYERVMQLTQDIVNSRVKKIIMLATAPTQTDNILQNLTQEERFLYERLAHLIQKWREKIIAILEEE